MRGKPAETKQRILSAASRLFYSKGVRAVGVDLISAEAGVTKRTLYHHFESKDALVAAYLEAWNEPVLAALIKSITRVPGGIIAQVEGLFLTFGKQAESAEWHGCPFARAVSELREFETDAVSSIAAKHKRAFEDWLSGYLSSNSVDDADLVARQLMILVDGAITQLLIHRDPSYANAAASAAIALISKNVTN